MGGRGEEAPPTPKAVEVGWGGPLPPPSSLLPPPSSLLPPPLGRGGRGGDGYSIFDVEHGVLAGQILERQEDETTGESKYRLRGDTASERQIELVAKLGPAGKMVIITVYAP